MQLPIRMSSAQALLQEYLSVVNAYVDDSEIEAQSELIKDLEDFQSKTTVLCENMLRILGYSGDLESMEKELNLAINELQQGTSYLNGEELGDFFIYELAKAAPYSFKLQNAYSNYLQNKFGIYLQEDLDNIDLEIFAKQLLEDAGIDAKGYVFHTNEDGTSIRGFGQHGTTPLISKTLAYGLLSTSLKSKKKFQEAIELGLNNTDATVQNNQITYSFQIDENTIYNFLKLKTSSYKNEDLESITSLIEKDENLVFNVKQILYNKIVSQYHGRFREIFENTVYKILNKAEPKDLFAGGNAVKKITGLLGEIQALYYIRVLAPKADINWTATQGSIQPHADIVLEELGTKYGIQVKNTQSNAARQEVEFESFKTKAVEMIQNGNLQLEFAKEMTDDYIGTIAQNSELFNAAVSLMGMEDFNIPYIWKKSRKKKNQTNIGTAKEVSIDKVPKFASTRLKIIEASEKAQKALVGFVAGMMYMQLKPLENAEANSLYIVGGTLAITSATILKDIIEDLKNDIMNVHFSLKEMHSRKGQYTIVDFLNSTSGHHLKQEFTLQSSYTFYKNKFDFF